MVTKVIFENYELKLFSIETLTRRTIISGLRDYLHIEIMPDERMTKYTRIFNANVEGCRR